jgi:hypothetical protein
MKRYLDDSSDNINQVKTLHLLDREQDELRKKQKCIPIKKAKPQRYINKNRVSYRYLDNEVSCQQLFCHIQPTI